MPAALRSLTYDAHDPERLARFWGELLEREPEHDRGGVLLRGDDTRVGLRFILSSAPRTGRDRVHLHLTSVDAADQRRVVDTVLAMGGSHLDVGQRPEEGHVVLADPEDNELCVIEPGNSFLAGCGFLAELACDGTRAVGRFWSEALGWPLVWDQDEETAIQSPYGGTKVAWGGPPVAAKKRPNRQRLELAVDDEPAAEVDRLVSLGAVRLDAASDGVVELVDPDGNEFWLSRVDQDPTVRTRA